MKVLLREMQSGSYVGKEVAWVGTPEVAAQFETLEAAGRKAREFAREDMAVVLRYESPECELALNPAYCASDTCGGDQRLRT